MVIPRNSRAAFRIYIFLPSSRIFPIHFSHSFLQIYFIRFIDKSQSLCLNFSNTSEHFPSLYSLQSRESRVTYAPVMDKFGECKLGTLSAGPSFFLLEHVTSRKCTFFPAPHATYVMRQPHLRRPVDIWPCLYLYEWIWIIWINIRSLLPNI